MSDGIRDGLSDIEALVEKTCPRCGGEGKVPYWPGGGFDLNPGNRPAGHKQCPKCNGSGKIKESN